MIVLHRNQLRWLRKAGLLPYPTKREKLQARQNNAEMIRQLTHPTRAEKRKGERLMKWLTTTPKDKKGTE